MLKSPSRVVGTPSGKPLHKQRGNTMVGIIIGLVIGLAIAVVVALAITKGSSPFTDRGSKASKQVDPAAANTSDPNQPMYGNKEAPHDAASKQDANKGADKENDSDTAPPAAAATPRAAPAPDALQQLVDKLKTDTSPVTPVPLPAQQARPGAAAPVAADPAAPAAADDKFVYYLQVGAFHGVADAESARAKLALLGFEAAISDRSTDAGVLHRVRVGPFNQVDAMNKARAKLSENGVDVAVVRNQK